MGTRKKTGQWIICLLEEGTVRLEAQVWGFLGEVFGWFFASKMVLLQSKSIHGGTGQVYETED